MTGTSKRINNHFICLFENILYMVKQINYSKKATLAYIKGVVIGDGWATYTDSTKRYEIGLQNTCKAFVEKFRDALREVGLEPYFGSKKLPSGNETWRTSANGKKLKEWLDATDSLSFREKEEIVAFLEGFYESDGVTKYACYTKTDLELIKKTQILLKRVNVNAVLNGPYKQNNDNWSDYYFLNIPAKDVSLFSELIDPLEHNEWITGR